MVDTVRALTIMQAVECDLHFMFVNDFFSLIWRTVESKSKALFNFQKEVNSEDLSILMLKSYFIKCNSHQNDLSWQNAFGSQLSGLSIPISEPCDNDKDT